MNTVHNSPTRTKKLGVQKYMNLVFASNNETNEISLKSHHKGLGNLPNIVFYRKRLTNFVEKRKLSALCLLQLSVEGFESICQINCRL